VAKGNSIESFESDEITIYQPLEDDDIYNVHRNVVEMSAKAMNEDAFMIIPAEEGEVEDVLFVHASIGKLCRVANFLRARLKEQLTKELLQDTSKLLKQMINFVTVTKTYVKETEKSEGMYAKRRKLQERQKIMRQLMVIEVLVDIIYYPFASGLYNLKQLTQKD